MLALSRKAALRPFLDGFAEYAKLLMLNGRISSFVQMACLSPLRESRAAQRLLYSLPGVGKKLGPPPPGEIGSDRRIL
jgi:hypothetical protein